MAKAKRSKRRPAPKKRASVAIAAYRRWMRRIKLTLMAIGLSIGTGFVALIVIMAQLPQVSHLAKEAPERSAYMETQAARTKEALVHRWVAIDDVSPNVIAAVVASEDGLFFVHHGIHWIELWNSVKANAKAMRIVRGAGTITLQTARNIFLTQEKSFWRKFRELLIGLKMEFYLDKGRILELYLNYAQWGPNLYGIEAASRRYFKKPSSALTREEAAALASCLPAPNKHRPNDPKDEWLKRRKKNVLEVIRLRPDIRKQASRLGAKPVRQTS